MYQEKTPTNHYVHCSKCNVPMFRIDARHVSVAKEVCPAAMCYKCLAESVKRAGESIRTYHVIVEIKNNYHCVVEANSPEEALAKYNEGEFDDFDFLGSEPPVAVEIVLASK